MKINLMILMVSVLMVFTLIACAGEDSLGKDKIPPIAPTLIPHLGDTGDPAVSYNGQSVYLKDENNGIDTVPDGDWIRLSWMPFIDTDLSHLKIYRYDEFNTVPVLIDSISSNNNQYVDISTLTVQTRYSYFVELVDFTGNSTVSDTVSYALLSKVNLVSPEAGSTVQANDVTFQWYRSGFASRYRVIVFNQNYEYVWHQDLDVSFEDTLLSLRLPVNVGPDYVGQTLIWRVDALEMDNELGIYIGSESYERTMHVQ